MEQISTLVLAEMNSRTIRETVKEYGKRLYGFIRGRVGSDEDAEDILQDVWYQLSRVTDLESIQQMSGWLFSVARNKITDRHRKKTETSLDMFMTTDETGLGELNSLLIAHTNTPEKAAETTQYLELILDAIETLPPKQREVFVMNELEDMTLEEIAAKTGENLKTIISRKRYAVRKLRENLQLIYNEISG